MESMAVGELVRVAAGGPEHDGIVFNILASAKVVVAVMDPVRGPVFRTVHPKALTERTETGPDDRALSLLIRRTPSPVRGATATGDRSGRGLPGHVRPAAHRATGK
jgi:hypothetical protein